MFLELINNFELGFWGHWIQIERLNFKIQNAGSNMADHKLKMIEFS